MKADIMLQEIACQSVSKGAGGKYMSSPQCTDTNPTTEMCLPSRQMILRYTDITAKPLSPIQRSSHYIYYYFP